MTDMVSVLDEHARTRGKELALRASGRDWTYAQLADASRRAATVLGEQGVGAGDRVALMNLNTPGFVFALFGAWRLGATVVPVNHKLQAPEVDYILGHSRIKLVVVDGTLAGLSKDVRTSTRWLATDTAVDGLGFFDALLEQASAHDGSRALHAPDVLAEILYTSGTTGQPKGCLHNHSNVFHTALCTAAITSLTHHDRTLIAMPVWHSSPLNNWLLGTLLMGGTVVLMREYAPKPFLDAIQDERITFTFGAPIAFLAPLAAVPDVEQYDLSSMRLWAYGGGPLGADMARKLAASYKSDRFVQVYGMTESGPLGTVLDPEEAIEKAGSIGRAGGPGVEIQVRNDDGSLCSAGQIGEIHLRTPAMMQGYLDDEEATRASFDDAGWYRSGDLAQIDEDGYLFIVDRLKDMIVTGGENVYSKEVEDVLSTHPDVDDVAVIGRPHPEWGETVVALLVLKPDHKLDEAGMKAFLEPKLARYKIPRSYEVHDHLPRTPSGKLMKHLLRA